jgi:GDPmannose 4,6-dehydratase
MLQRDKPEDFVLGSGIARTGEDFCKEAFKCVNIDDWQNYIYIDPQFYRPSDVEYLKSKTTKANTILGWKPEISFEQMVKEMVDHDISEAKKAN